jgi:hypothetical protein
MSLPAQVSWFATAAGNFFHFLHSCLIFHLAVSYFFPLIRKLLMGCGFEFTDTINAVVMESIH